ncbi:baculoviral IAP repeat-containing protein 7-A-like [Tigriopus californicus]|uniref:baculoviral IAP repeat-containing protein 7-A-like n=1 Tax=Tigriopus californicus TaxID=6832 RepID=UPI0027DA0423|nr:baculoviral IAP repeat-containing protein 7-A-like [Tigriopus californicus]
MGSAERIGSVLRFEERRLSTFQNWPANAKVDARKIAKAGFHHTGREAQVKCAWCGCVLSEWNYGDQVMARHRAAKPSCPFVLNKSDNVPLLSMNQHPDPNADPEPRASSSPDQEDFQAVSDPPSDNDIYVANGNEAERMEGGEEEDVVSFQSLPPPLHTMRASDPENLVMSANLKEEAKRLRTFINWPNTRIHPKDLAKAGFYYTGVQDCVRCIFCGEYVGHWDPNDDPAREHRAIFPQCPFVQGRDVGNIPLPSSETQSSGDEMADDPFPTTSSERPPLPNGSTLAYDLAPSSSRLSALAAGEDDAGIRPRPPVKVPPPIFWSSAFPSKPMDTNGIIHHSGPTNSKFSTLEARLRTFREWPPALRQKPKDMAEAGFFYIGLSDQVKCFYCDGGLRNWQAEDDPWTEHCRWFSKCGFVRLIKGDEFIAKCVSEKPPEGLSKASGAKMSSDRVNVAYTEEDMKRYMRSPFVQEVLGMGIDLSRVKVAIRNRIRSTGREFTSVDDLINAAFGVHREQEDVAHLDNNSSPSPFASNNPSRQNSFTQQGSVDIEPSPSGSDETGSHSIQVSQEPSTSFSRNSAPPPPLTSSLSVPNVSATAESNEACPQVPVKSITPTPEVMKTKSLGNPMTEDLLGQDQLEQENRRLKEQRTCKICMDNEIGVVFLPCGHLICCVQCAPALKDCPLCRQSIVGTVKTYMS